MAKTIYHAKEDTVYARPYVDIEETRTRAVPGKGTVDYNYVHGGFEGTNVKFSLCFPEKGAYTGRFFHYLSPFPGPDEELASLNKKGADDIIAFCLMNGAYFVESNMGSAAAFGPKGDNTEVWKSSAAVAEYSRVKAKELYGCDRPFGYVFGGSGGGYKTMACIENTDAWDGAVPFVIGTPVSLPNTISMHVQGQRCLRNVFGKVVDSLDAGGSGDPYEGLTKNEADMLRELTAMGFNPKIWFVEASGVINDGSLPVLTPGVKMSDPGYFKEFWKTPGYAGADRRSSAVQDRLVFRGKVVSAHKPGEKVVNEDEAVNGVDTAWKKQLTDGAGAWIELESVPAGDDLYLHGVNITVLTGASAGKTLLLKDIVGNYLTIGMCFGMDDLASVLENIRPGDEVELNNSDYIAIQHYYRHQVPADPAFHAWDQFRDENGEPAIPQRKSVMGYSFTGTGTVQDGDIQGKVIVVQSLMDESTVPWSADWYRHTVAKAKDGEQDFRLYYMDRCMHGDVEGLENTMVTNYLGALHQSLLDVSDWVERGIEPRPTTVYKYDNGQIIPAKTAKERRGIQPVVELMANGSACAHVKVGEKVTFTATAVVPEGAGEVTGLSFGFVDNWKIPCETDCFPVEGQLTPISDDGLKGAKATAEYTYDAPGTYFAAVLAQSNRHGNDSDPFTQVKNIARVRVIVE